jgi:Ni/Fe-hydrogenase b-type cytochrome subunit
MRDERLDHPAVVRFCHWLVALAVPVLIASGLEVFAAFPSFADKIPAHEWLVPPAGLRLGGWLGGAWRRHLTFAWVLAGAGLVYVVYQIKTGNYRQVLFTLRDMAGVWSMVRHYLLLGPEPFQRGTYNSLQKLAYTVVIGLLVALVVTGAALHKPVQLSWLATLLGGFRLARVWHFAAMCALLAFIPVHVLMVALHGWRNFASMWIGIRANPLTHSHRSY